MDVAHTLSGYSTSDALRILHAELLEELLKYESKQKRMSWRLFMCRHFLYHDTIYSVFHWTSLGLIVICCLLLFVCYGLQEDKDHWLLIVVFIMIMIFMVNVCFMRHIEKLRNTEHVNKAKKVLDKVRECMKEGLWQTENYIDLNIPQSPCVSLQWTIRDSCVVNLPWCFLVEGDIILLRPGQVVPAHCRSMQTEQYDEQTYMEYVANDLYNPTQNISEPDYSKIEARQPLKPQPFVMLETPFTHCFKQYLDEARVRPIGALDRERYMVYSLWIERRLLPAILLLALLINGLRYIFFRSHVGRWYEMIVLLQICCAVPLMALVFPIVWKLIDCIGVAKVLLTRENTIHASVPKARHKEKLFIKTCNPKTNWDSHRS